MKNVKEILFNTVENVHLASTCILHFGVEEADSEIAKLAIKEMTAQGATFEEDESKEDIIGSLTTMSTLHLYFYAKKLLKALREVSLTAAEKETVNSLKELTKEIADVIEVNKSDDTDYVDPEFIVLFNLSRPWMSLHGTVDAILEALPDDDEQ